MDSDNLQLFYRRFYENIFEKSRARGGKEGQVNIKLACCVCVCTRENPSIV